MTVLTTNLTEILQAQIPKALAAKALPWLAKSNYWQVALILGEYMNTAECTDTVAIAALITTIREYMGEQAVLNQSATIVEFGTSGWRGRIGEDFTIRNVHIVVKALVDMLQTSEFIRENKYASFKDVQKNGIIVFRDNRYMGDEFMAAAMHELAAAGVKIYQAGECPTGVGSALVTMLKAAGSINFTPSHNPMDAAGLKFNPADGGPAGANLTSIIQDNANALMQTGYTPSAVDYAPFVELIDPIELYSRYLHDSKVIDLEKLKNDLYAKREELRIIVDNMHGSSRTFVERLFGTPLINVLDISFLNTHDDYSFHGLKPEPSAKNQKPLMELLQRSDKRLRLAVALDPDADRIRFADHAMDLDMNKFSAIALQHTLDRGLRQGVTYSVASSAFAAAIARAEGLAVTETAVGFKNFREVLSQNKAALAFEESDGISFIGHTLEKDGVIGFLVAVAAMMHNNKNISELYTALQNKYGAFYPGKDGEDLPGISIAEWQAYRVAVMNNLKTMFNVGDVVVVDSKNKNIISISTVDGVKMAFDDQSWILLRPSGTEAKFRYYYEAVGVGADALLPAYKTAASAILQKARDLVK